MTFRHIPITVFTGFLGAGKTTIILSLLPQLPQDYKVVLLKNEFGNIEVDSQLAKQSSLAAVSEVLNGCMCCVLVGQMKTALLEIREKYEPDRIIIECSGSAFPATLAFQIRELERETQGHLKLDAIVTVVDAENFIGYEDSSPTAKMQSSYTDIILINKWEQVSERALDFVIDHLNTLNELTPKIKCQSGKVDPTLIFGIESGRFSFSGLELEEIENMHNDEVETVTILRAEHGRHDERNENCPRGKTDYGLDGGEIEEKLLIDALACLSKESVWRVKGFVKLGDGTHILNWAFGRFQLMKMEPASLSDSAVKFTAMGERGEIRKAVVKFCEILGAKVL